MGAVRLHGLSVAIRRSRSADLFGFRPDDDDSKDDPIRLNAPEAYQRPAGLFLRLAIIAFLLVGFSFYPGLPQALLHKYLHSERQVGSIHWQQTSSCHPRTKCGSITVPKHYFDEAAGTDLIGNDWDLVGFDPRGINMALPRVACFPYKSTINLFSANTILEKGFIVSSSNISGSDIRASIQAELVV
uniref:Uncharacterized protein n=1 Tax=Mycena chlorophos TaxID=658473 RepID=A0ABQ0LIR5_MYCCL|nr:predicted protein [Mycena chlorophos]